MEGSVHADHDNLFDDLASWDNHIEKLLESGNTGTDRYNRPRGITVEYGILHFLEAMVCQISRPTLDPDKRKELRIRKRPKARSSRVFVAVSEAPVSYSTSHFLKRGIAWAIDFFVGDQPRRKWDAEPHELRGRTANYEERPISTRCNSLLWKPMSPPWSTHRGGSLESRCLEQSFMPDIPQDESGNDPLPSERMDSPPMFNRHPSPPALAPQSRRAQAAPAAKTSPAVDPADVRRRTRFADFPPPAREAGRGPPERRRPAGGGPKSTAVDPRAWRQCAEAVLAAW